MKKLFLLITVIIAGTSVALAQKTVSGKVTDRKDGTPVQGATISVKGN